MRRGKSKYPGRGKAIWSQEQKLQACASYVMLGTLRETALATSIPMPTLSLWSTQEWWKELKTQIRDEDIQQMDSNLQKIITKALKATEDRLDEGDYTYHPLTGKAIRVPIKAQIALKISTDLMIRQDKIRERPEKAELEKTIDARLAKLGEEFAKFSKARDVTPEVLPQLGAIIDGN